MQGYNYKRSIRGKEMVFMLCSMRFPIQNDEKRVDIIWPAHRRAHGTMCLGPFPPRKKANVTTLGPRFLVKFPRVGEAIEVKCPTYARGPPRA